MTKEELIRDLARDLAVAKEQWDSYSNEDSRLRQEFAKAFSWYKNRGAYDYSEAEPKKPTWEQIFVEVGKLLARLNAYDMEGNISELECAVEQIKLQLNKE